MVESQGHVPSINLSLDDSFLESAVVSFIEMVVPDPLQAPNLV